MEQPTEQTRTSNAVRKDGRSGSWLKNAALLLIAPACALFLMTFVFQTYQVSGESMQNTLQNNDRLLVWKGTKSWDTLFGRRFVPARGDIVIVSGSNFYGCEHPDGQIVKRVIGLPGERVVYAHGAYTVYNPAHPHGFNPDASLPYGSAGTAEFSDPAAATVDVTLSDTQLFVSGDHRADSCDSRIFGPVETSQVQGTLVARILPLSRAERF